MPFFAVDISANSGLILDGDGAETVCLKGAFPILAGLGSPPSQVSYRRCGKRYAFVRSDPRIVSGETSDLAVLYYSFSEHDLVLLEFESCEIRTSVSVEGEVDASGAVGKSDVCRDIRPVVEVFDGDRT